jgi:hypothetical protein
LLPGPLLVVATVVAGRIFAAFGPLHAPAGCEEIAGGAATPSGSKLTLGHHHPFDSVFPLRRAVIIRAEGSAASRRLPLPWPAQPVPFA